MNIREHYWRVMTPFENYGRAVFFDAGGLVRDMPASARRILSAWLAHRIPPRLYALYGLSSVPADHWSEYLIDYRGFLQTLHSRNPPEMRRLSDNKLAFHQHCRRTGLPSIPILCVIVGGNRPPTELSFAADTPLPERIGDLNGWLDFLASAPHELFVKPIDGGHGDDAFSVIRKSGRFEFAGRTGSAEAICDYLRGLTAYSGWIVQPRMRNDSRMTAAARAKGLVTMRVVTCMRDEEPHIVAAIQKIIVGGNEIDNFSASATGNVVAAIDPISGALSAASGSSRRNWPVMKRYAEHPETGERSQGIVLPYWPEVKSLALRAQASVPRFKSVGWDIAATDQGVMLVEANGGYDASIMQVAHQRGMKQELMSAIEP